MSVYLHNQVEKKRENSITGAGIQQHHTKDVKTYGKHMALVDNTNGQYNPLMVKKQFTWLYHLQEDKRSCKPVQTIQGSPICYLQNHNRADKRCQIALNAEGRITLHCQGCISNGTNGACTAAADSKVPVMLWCDVWLHVLAATGQACSAIWLRMPQLQKWERTGRSWGMPWPPPATASKLDWLYAQDFRQFTASWFWHGTQCELQCAAWIPVPCKRDYPAACPCHYCTKKGLLFCQILSTSVNWLLGNRYIYTSVWLSGHEWQSHLQGTLVEQMGGCRQHWLWCSPPWQLNSRSQMAIR